MFCGRAGRSAAIKTLFDDISAAAGRLDRYRQKGNVMRILLIEDDKNLCETLKYQLEREGILVDACTDGLDGLHYMKEDADDYIVKPFAFPELLARIHSLSRRSGQWETGDCLTYRDICYNVALRQLTKEGQQLLLSRREGALLKFFLRNTGQTLPRGLLLSRVWGPDAEVEDGNLDNYIHFLRRRLKAVQSEVSLTTVRGVGYVLE